MNKLLNILIKLELVSILPSLVNCYALLDIRQDEKAKLLHRLDSLNILAYVFLLILTVCTIWLFKRRRIQFLHETGLAIFYGLIVGAIIRYVGQETGVTHLSVRPYQNLPNATNSTVYLQGVPPDALWIQLKVPVVNGEDPAEPSDQSYVKRWYAYVFRGELINKQDTLVDKQISEKATFDPEIFFNIILPPIIFNAGYSLKRRFFFRNMGAIMTYAFVGTTISCFTVGLVMRVLVYLMPTTLRELSFNDCLYFGAIISATDPVTVLAIFNDLHVDVTLYALVFGESILNDAIAITLAGSIDSFAKHYNNGFFTAVFRAFGNFVYIFVLSFVQGSSIGCATALLTKFTKLCDFPLLESSLFVLMSYSTFLMAEALDLSGIVAVLFCGICQAHYTYNNLSDESRNRTKSLFELCNFIAENFIFTYIGVSIFTFPRHLWSFWFIVTAIIAILLGRALNVYPLSFILNLGRNNKIPINFQHVLFFSGLRGAMAFALAIRNTLTEPRRLMLTSTSLISIFTVIVCGGCTPALLQQLRVPVGVEEAEHEMLQFSGVRRSGSAQTPQDLRSPSITAEQPTRSAYEKAWIVRKWYNFDVRFMKPLLTHSKPSLMDTLPECCLPLARLLTTTQQMSADEYHRRVSPDRHLFGQNDSKTNFLQTDSDSDDDLVLQPTQQDSNISRTNSTEYQSTDYNRSAGYLTNNTITSRPTTLQPIDRQKVDNNLIVRQTNEQNGTNDEQTVRRLDLEPNNRNNFSLSSHLDSNSFI